MTLLQNLINWQQEQARKEHLEPYMVLQFNTIKEIVRLQPKTHDELIRIKGIGPAKVRKYGDALLKIVRGNGVVGNESVMGKDLFSEAQAVNEAALRSDNPPKVNEGVQYDPETGEILEKDEENAPVTVTEFVTMLDTALRTHFRSIRVQGEIVGFKRNANGHAYFEIKDKESVLRCAVFRSSYELSGIDLEDGMEIIVTGCPNYHKKYGFSFVGNTVELHGEGALKKAYDELKKKLDGERLFDEERKRSVPELPRKIGLITSRTGAAIGDFMSNVGQYGYHISFHHTSVEGSRALAEIKKALDAMSKKDIDILVIVRGGGSLESLQAFNNEKIARMIADFPVPVVVGVGHDEDETIATLIADVGASTPTGAARAVRESWDQCEKKVQSYESGLLYAFDNALQQHKNTIETVERRLFAQVEKIISYFNNVFNLFSLSVHKIDVSIQSQKSYIQRAQEKICDQFGHRVDHIKRSFDIFHMTKEFKLHISHIEEKLSSYEKSIAHNDPMRQLSLGYSITRDKKGDVVRKVSDIKKGDDLFVQVSDGNISTQAK